MFDIHLQNFSLPFPYKGIDTNAKNDSASSKYIQNMLVSDSKTGRVRFGTNFISEHEFDPDRIFTDPIEILDFFKNDGTTEQIIYQLYLTEIQFLNIIAHVTIEPCATNLACSTITIDLTSYTADQKKYFNNIIFDEVYLFVKQNNSNGDYITNYNLSVDGNTLTFDFPFKSTFFETDLGANNFSFWIERGGIYKKNNTNYELLEDNLDPNVVISSVTFQKKLLIANGVNPVKVYDGESIVDLKSPYSIVTDSNEIVINNHSLIFKVINDLVPILQQDLSNGSILTLVYSGTVEETSTETKTIDHIDYGVPDDNLVEVTITLDSPPNNGTREIIYQKLCPSFSYLAIAKRRLWALPEGRAFKNKFRIPELSLKAYYAYKIESVDEWFNDKSEIGFILGEPNNSGIPDNWEAIKPFSDKVLFLGRDTIQVWSGYNPDLVNDALPDFIHDETISIGLYQKKMIVDAPNALSFLSKLGFAIARIDNLTQRLSISYSFGNPIDYHLKNQLSFIENEKDYRSMVSFVYPYGRFLGFKIKYSCLIYQLNDEGAWLVFTGNFSDATSFCYDPTTKDLYLGLKTGIMLSYADKTSNRSFEDYNIGKISWIISYNWLDLGNTWFNTYIYVSARTLKEITLNIRIFVDNNLSVSDREQIIINQEGVLYDAGTFNISKFADADTGLFRELIRFTCNFLILDISGLSNDLLTIDQFFLTGGTQN